MNISKEDGMYYINNFSFDMKDVKNRHLNVLKSLTLFAPYPHELEVFVKNELKFSTVSINKKTSFLKNDFDFIQYVRKHLLLQEDNIYLNPKEQDFLREVILCFVKKLWINIKDQAYDPFYDEQENQEALSRIVARIVTVCQYLFSSFAHKLIVLNQRGIFSGPANMIRLKTSLICDSQKLLNYLTIRRSVLEEFRVDQKSKDSLIIDSKSHQNDIDLQRVILEKPINKSMITNINLNKKKLNRTDFSTDITTKNHHESTMSTPKRKKILERSLSFSCQSPVDKLNPVRSNSSCISFSVSEEKLIQPKNHQEKIHQDLQHLLLRQPNKITENENDENNMPPLLQVITKTLLHNSKDTPGTNNFASNECFNEIEFSAPKQLYPQPSTVSRVSNQQNFRTSDIRVSRRFCLSDVTLNKFPTVFNHLTDEIDAETVKTIDSNIFLGDEITEVYKEIMKTLPVDHLNLDNDDTIEPSAEYVNTTFALASSSLMKPKNERVLNEKLLSKQEPPWDGVDDIIEWSKNPVNAGIKLHTHGGPSIVPQTAPTNSILQPSGNMFDFISNKIDTTMESDPIPKINNEIMANKHASWYNWWRHTLNSDDYMKYLSTQETDYLGAVFHFYNANVEENLNVEITANEVKINEDKKNKSEHKQTQKSDFQLGLWNVKSLLFDDTKADSDQNIEVEINASKTKELGLPLQSLRSSATVIGRRTPLPLNSVASSNFEKLNESQETSQGHKTKRNSLIKEQSVQSRLEAVWNSLLMKDSQKLDMAIKYSFDHNHLLLKQALEDWEAVTNLILKRESIILKLENFERTASDPIRFFEKGIKGSSINRLEEAKIRSTMYKKIEDLDTRIKCLLNLIKDQYQDIVTFKGRPYFDKMKWDRTEMLYWLQEERKQSTINLNQT